MYVAFPVSVMWRFWLRHICPFVPFADSALPMFVSLEDSGEIREVILQTSLYFVCKLDVNYLLVSQPVPSMHRQQEDIQCDQEKQRRPFCFQNHEI